MEKGYCLPKHVLLLMFWFGLIVSRSSCLQPALVHTQRFVGPLRAARRNCRGNDVLFDSLSFSLSFYLLLSLSLLYDQQANGCVLCAFQRPLGWICCVACEKAEVEGAFVRHKLFAIEPVRWSCFWGRFFFLVAFFRLFGVCFVGGRSPSHHSL